MPVLHDQRMAAGSPNLSIGRLPGIDASLAAVLPVAAALRVHALGLWSLRLPSAAVYMTYRLGALWFSRRIGLCAALLSAINVEQIQRSQEMRQYPLLLCSR